MILIFSTLTYLIHKVSMSTSEDSQCEISDSEVNMDAGTDPSSFSDDDEGASTDNLPPIAKRTRQ